MHTHQLPGGIYRGIRLNLWGQAQGTPQDSIPIHHHSHSTGYPVSPECFTIVDKKGHRGSPGTSRRPYIFVLMTLHLIGTWESTNSHTFWIRFYRTHHHSRLNNTVLSPIPPHMGQPHTSIPYNKLGGMCNYIGKYCFLWECLLHITLTISIIPPPTPHAPKHPINQKLPYTPISVAPSLVRKDFYLCSLTFSHRPDEAASVWRLQKLVCNKLMDLLCFSTQEML